MAARTYTDYEVNSIITHAMCCMAVECIKHSDIIGPELVDHAMECFKDGIEQVSARVEKDLDGELCADIPNWGEIIPAIPANH